jgi:hypothetical protein
VSAWPWLLGGGLALVAFAGAKKKTATPVQTHYVAADIPPPQQGVQPPKPPGASGMQSLGEEAGRGWFTVPIDRNGSKKREGVILRIPDFGDGVIEADIFESIEPPGDVPWPEGFACGGRRWRLVFKDGTMISANDVTGVNGFVPLCLAGARTIERSYLRKMSWVQRGGGEIVLKVQTLSGLWKHAKQPWGQCEAGGQCDKWDNDFVDSGHALIDVVWKVVG